MDLFDHKTEKLKQKEAPLADRLRPRALEDFVGQKDVVGKGSALRTLLERDDVPSMIFWGPPGTGKTTLARIIAQMTVSRFVPLSAVSSGVAELRSVVQEAQEFLKLRDARTIVFVDEIHRWNKAQQDAFLPYVEDGTVTLIGATTENPSFEVNSALLSRTRVFVLERLEDQDILQLLRRALEDQERGLGEKSVTVEDGVLELIAQVADGDARASLNALEMAVKSTPARDVRGKGNVVHLRRAACAKMLSRTSFRYDKNGEEHYNIISALHKSIRGSDAQAALYWLGRMLGAGEDPLYIARRLVRFASEDIGLADPQALVQANAAFDTAHKLGMPECDTALAQAVAYMARAPKSNALYVAVGRIKRDLIEAPNAPVPVHLRNAPTKLMKELGYGKDYIYTPDDPNAQQDFLPDALKGRIYLED